MAKKKNLLSAAVTAVAAVGALGLGGASSPVGQEVMNSVQNTQIVQKASRSTSVRVTQQQAQQQTQRVYSSSQSVYLPYGYGDRIIGKFTLTPKEYGEYLLRSGKNKYNNRCRKLLARALG